MGQNEATLSTHPARSETKKVTDKEPTRPVRNTRTWMKTTSYGKTKQHLFVGLLLGVIVLSTQAQALSIEQAPIGQAPICCCIRCPVRVLQAGLERERVLQEEPICHRLREVPERRWRQTISLLQGKQRQVPLLRRGLERERLLQEEPINWRLREVQELLPGIQCQVRVLQAGHQRGRVLQEEPIY